MSDTPEPKYPEHEKLQLVHMVSQQQGAFLDWLRDEHNLILAEADELRYTTRRIEDLLAEYHDIDLKKLEDEKRAMLDEMRKANAQP